MGTSASAKGPNSRSPLVPPWADATPGVPVPQPEGQRFRGFRTEFGKVASGSGGSLGKALQKYASAATGGSSVGPRRFGPAYAAGADLAQALSSGQVQTQSGAFELSSLAGLPMDEAAQAIAEALAPENADADQVRAAIQESLAEVLGEDGGFNPDAITPDQIVAVLVEFFSQILFQEISAAAGDAWKKAPSVERSTATENELLEVVRASMDAHLSPGLSGDLGALDREQIAKIEQAALADIWQVWSDSE
jgi:hypothetical protein